MTSKPVINQAQNNTAKALTCEQLESFIVDYIDGKLPAAQRSTFDLHRKQCPDCDHYLENYSNTIKLGQLAYSDDDQGNCDAIPENLVQAILDASKKS